MLDLLLERDDLEGLPETIQLSDLYEQADDGKYRLTAKLDGVKPVSEFDKVNEALRKERGDHKAIKDRFRALGDKDPAELLAALDEMDELKAQLDARGEDLTDDKVEELVEKRLLRIKAPLDRELGTIKEQLAARDEALAAKSRELDDLYIGQHLNELAAKHCDPAVVRDVVEIGRGYLIRDEDGEIVTRGDSPLPAVEWIKGQLEERQHWNKPSGGGGGGRGNQGGKGKAKNPFVADNVDWSGHVPRWNPGALAAQDAYLSEHGQEAYVSAARAAGVDPSRPGSFPPRPAPNGRAA